MRKHLLSALAAAAICVPSAFAADADPVLMTVDGHDVRVSEFEYLYNKNNNQQLQQQSLDDYLKLFIDYKLKVADAEHAGIDTTLAFEKEFATFRNDLANPYLRDNDVADALVMEAYGHRDKSVLVSHIMMNPTPEAEITLDSLRREILAGNITFEDAAAQYSTDRPSAVRGGRMGYVVPDRFPWAFEKAAYETEVGQISPVINSGLGFHIIRTESVEPSQGEVLAEHILLLTQRVPEQLRPAVKERIDSIYNVAVAGADFADLARRFSQDPGSAREGGRLPWFTRGMMVAQFDSTAFAMADGEISKPFETPYGYHIIHRIDHRTKAPLEDIRADIESKMTRDDRATAPERAFIERKMIEKKAVVNSDVMAELASMLGATLDSATIVALSASDLPVASVGNDKVTLSEVMKYAVPVPGNPMGVIEAAAQRALQARVRELALADLYANNADYRNLINEYRDGILLYEISNRNVWDRAAKDTDGLNEFFRRNADRYAWTSPKFKSYVIFSTSDSILAEALKFADTLKTANTADFNQAMRKRFGRDIKVERVIAAKGENPITDYLAFGGEKPSPETANKWTSYAAWHGRVIDAPEEASDVRGAAVTDYQNELEKEWLDKLHDSYKVNVNQKVLKKLQKKYK